MKRYATTLIIWGSLLLSELHTLWEESTASANWILTKNIVMPLQWNVKYVTDEVWFVLIGLSIYYYQPNRINTTTVKAYVGFCIFDLLMYFYNYKQEGYGWGYTLLLISWIIIYNRYGRNTTSKRQGITFETQR